MIWIQSNRRRSASDEDLWRLSNAFREFLATHASICASKGRSGLSGTSMTSLKSILRNVQGAGSASVAVRGWPFFVVDISGPTQEGSVSLPYEFFPLPKKGEDVLALDREGGVVGTGTVQKVQRKKNKRSVITIAVPKDLVMVVRNVRLQEGSHAKR